MTTEDSEPEPDVMIVRGSRRDYAQKHPSAADVALVVEVANSTLQRDKTVKLGIYAQAEIPTYWLLNLLERQLEIYTQPKDVSYQSCQIYQASDSLDFWFEGQKLGTIVVADLLP
jgi:Uma2 family endonuclease